MNFIKIIKPLKKYIPQNIWNFYREIYVKNENKQFFLQKSVKFKVGKFTIDAPKNYPLIKLMKSQPYRDLCIGISAKYISKKYPDGTIIDIGANIGDTACMIASYCSNSLILVEPSNFYYTYLVKNSKTIPNKIVLVKSIISDGNDIIGELSHWGGTAFISNISSKKDIYKTKKLSEISDNKTAFIKIDTDGYDIKIILSSLDWIEYQKPGILFENQIRNKKDLEEADSIFEKLFQIGYKFYIVWDDAGFYLVSTNTINILENLNFYMYKIFENDGYKSIHNFDILCLHEKDIDIYNSINKHLKEVQII